MPRETLSPASVFDELAKYMYNKRLDQQKSINMCEKWLGFIINIQKEPYRFSFYTLGDDRNINTCDCASDLCSPLCVCLAFAKVTE